MTRFAGFGAFFAVETHGPGASPGEPWRAMVELVADPDVLATRVGTVRAALARTGGQRVDEVDLRVAVSTTQLGLVSRLVAPLVAAAATGGDRPDLRIRQLWWQDTLGAPFPLSVTPIAASGATPVLRGTAVESITEAVARQFAVSPQVLWGNVGSAANTAARLVSESRPGLAARARAGADALLADPRVDGGTSRSGPGYRRRSCCLIYRLTGNAAAVCGDCVLSR